MHIEELREYCLAKKFVAEDFPFGDTTLVFKVKGKIFLIAGLERLPFQFNVKCDPDKAIELREQFDCVQPGYHMNKKHWNTIIANGCLSDKLMKEQIDHSYSLIVSSLPAKDKKGF